MFRLTLEPQRGTDMGMSHPAKVHFYQSDMTHPDGSPLVSVVIKGRGIRLTVGQVVELRNWLNDWLKEERG